MFPFADLEYSLGHGDPIEEIAIVLRRDVAEVKAKIEKLQELSADCVDP